MKAPTEVTINTLHVEEIENDVELFVEADEDVQEDEMFIDLGQEAMEVMGVVSDWNIDDYVAVKKRYLGKWYPGQITNINEDDTIKVSCLEYVNKIETSNKFCKPRHPDIKDYHRDEKLNDPIKVAGKRSEYFKLNDDDFDYASELLRMVIR